MHPRGRSPARSRIASSERLYWLMSANGIAARSERLTGEREENYRLRPPERHVTRPGWRRGDRLACASSVPLDGIESSALHARRQALLWAAAMRRWAARAAR